MKKTRPKKRIIKRAKKPAKKKKVVKKKPARKKAVKKPATAKARKKQKRKKVSASLRRAKRGSATQRLQRKPVKKKPATAKARKKQKRKKVSASLRRAKRGSATQRLQRKAKKRVVKRKKVVKRKRRKPAKKAKKSLGRRRRPTGPRLAKGKEGAKKRKVIRKKPAKRRRKKTRMTRRAYSGGGPLEQLFESQAKVRVMKLFFRNPEVNFLLKEAAKIMKMNSDLAKKQIKRLEKIGLLKTRQVSPRKQLFSINPNFDFFNELRELILKSSPVSKDKMLKAIRGLGRIKLALLSGLFIGNDMSRADLLIVGDGISRRKLAGFIKNLEAEAGTDINCVIMTTEEFKYRYDMYDRFVRDLLSEKGELLINRLGM